MILLATLLHLKWACKFPFFSPPLCLVISSADNNNFSKWDAYLGSSYMCRKEQTLEVNEDLQIHTFNLWIQPFLVKENKFSTGKSSFFVNSCNACKFLTCLKAPALDTVALFLKLVSLFWGFFARGMKRSSEADIPSSRKALFSL